MNPGPGAEARSRPVAPSPLVPLRALRARGLPPTEAALGARRPAGMTVTRRLRSRARSVRPAAAALQAGELSWGEQGAHVAGGRHSSWANSSIDPHCGSASSTRWACWLRTLRG